MTNGKFVAYYRVSTAKQGQSGLGLDAQRDAVHKYLNDGRHKLLKEFVEVESGNDNDRPQLAKALHRAKVTGATLVIAKLDRLSRNAAFIANLQESKVKFVCCDMRDATHLTVHIFAGIAQHEREMISKRTKDAMAAAKNNPVWRKKHPNGFGNPKGARHLRGLGNDAAVEAIKAKADKFAEYILPIIEDIKANGMVTLREIAAELNAQGIETANVAAARARDPEFKGESRWYASTVRGVLQRASEAA